MKKEKKSPGGRFLRFHEGKEKQPEVPARTGKRPILASIPLPKKRSIRSVPW